MSITEKTKDSKPLEKVAVEKVRYFTFLLYPDSSPEDFQIKLSELDVPMAISPLHDKDVSKVDKETGEITFKKPHYHVIYIANNPVTADSVRKKLQRALGREAVAMVKTVDSVPSLYEYLTHDSKSAIAKGKHRYNKADIVHLNNFDIDRYRGNSLEEKEDFLVNVWDLVSENRICNAFEMREFIDKNPDCGVTKRKFMKLMMSNPGALNLIFTGTYHQRQYEREKEAEQFNEGVALDERSE